MEFFSPLLKCRRTFWPTGSVGSALCGVGEGWGKESETVLTLFHLSFLLSAPPECWNFSPGFQSSQKAVSTCGWLLNWWFCWGRGGKGDMRTWTSYSAILLTSLPNNLLNKLQKMKKTGALKWGLVCLSNYFPLSPVPHSFQSIQGSIGHHFSSA